MAKWFTVMSTPHSTGADPIVVDALVYSEAERVLRGVSIGKTSLNAGFTAVIDLGNSGSFFDVTLKNAIQKGYVEGPRMFVSGPILSTVGGHFYNLPSHLSSLVTK